MKKSIDINIIKVKHVKNTPFKFIVYTLKDTSKVIMEDVQKGKAIICDICETEDIIRLNRVKTDWIRSFDDGFIKFDNNIIYHLCHFFQRMLDLQH